MTLPDWLDSYILGNAMADWITAGSWALGATVAILLLRWVAMRRLAVLAARTDTIADDAVIEAVQSISPAYVLLIALGGALRWLQFPRPAHRTISGILIFVAVLQAIRTGNRIVDFFANHYAKKKEGLDRTTLRALSWAGRVVLWITIIVVALEVSGIEVKTLLTGLGVGGIAIALAVQNILGDLFAALSIVLDKPFVVGDSIAVDTFEGDVVHIGLKSTRVRSVNGEEVVFANTDLLKSRLRNLNRRRDRRLVMTLVVAPGTPATRVAIVPALVADIVKADGRARLQRAHLMGTGLSGPEIEAAIVVPGIDGLMALDIRQSILLGIMARLEREGIVLAKSALVASSGAAPMSVPSVTPPATS